MTIRINGFLIHLYIYLLSDAHTAFYKTSESSIHKDEIWKCLLSWPYSKSFWTKASILTEAPQLRFIIKHIRIKCFSPFSLSYVSRNVFFIHFNDQRMNFNRHQIFCNKKTYDRVNYTICGTFKRLNLNIHKFTKTRSNRNGSSSVTEVEFQDRTCLKKKYVWYIYNYIFI